MPADLPELVRRSCRQVVGAAQLVSIDLDALDRLAYELAPALAPHPDSGRPAGAGGDDEGHVALVLALDAVNFGSGWHDVVRKRPGLSGARTMAAGLRDEVARSGPLTAERLRALTVRGCVDIFGQDVGVPEQAELMALFARALADLGLLVAERYGSSFLALVADAGGSAVALAESLLAMPMYRDRVELDGAVVHFYKRAQITAADLHRDCPGVAVCRFRDLERLTAFADNLVPHVLRVDGVLRYDAGLAAWIDGGRLLPHGSRAEVEIRAAGVHAVELLVDALGAAGTTARPMDVDLALWSRGGNPRYKAIPRHRSRTASY